MKMPRGHFIAIMLGSLWLVGCYSTVLAQTNIISFTNSSGMFISNATALKIAENKLLYQIPAGGGIVRLDSLPTNIQSEFNYNPVKAAAADKHEQQAKLAVKQADAARQKYLVSLRGPVLTVKVFSCDDYGYCQLSYQDETDSQHIIQATAYLIPVPKQVRDFCDYNAELENEITVIANEYISVTVPNSVAPVLEFNQPSGTYSIGSVDSSRADAQEVLTAAVGKKRATLRILKTALQQRQAQGTTVNAFYTGLSRNGVPIWRPIDK